MRDTVKEVVDVHFQDILYVFWIGVDPLLDDFLGFVGASPWDAGVAMLVHTLPEHLLQSLNYAMLHDQFLQSRHYDFAFLMPNTVLNDLRLVLRILVIDDPIVRLADQFIIRQIAPSDHIPDTLRLFSTLHGSPPIGF